MPGDAPGLTPSLAWFVRRHLRSLEDLEILLLLWRTPERWWTATAVAHEVRTTTSMATDSLQWLSGGLCRPNAESETGYQLAPARPEDRSALQALDALYRENRQELLRAVAPHAPALQD